MDRDTIKPRKEDGFLFNEMIFVFLHHKEKGAKVTATHQ